MSADDKPKIDARELSLAQLHRLAVRGSRRARAELERRMAALDAQDHSEPRSDTTPGPADVAAAPVPQLTSAASLQEMAGLAATLRATSGAAGMTFPGNREAPPQDVQEAQILRLQALAQQDEARQRAQGPPELVGMALMAWGALVLLGGLALLTRKGGLYYTLFGLACMVIGWLLLRCKRAAIWVHVACVVTALPWAWFGYPGNTVATALLQSAPIWIAALWIAVPAVREPLN
ncbi:MAG: hypothetical protein LBU72_02630 [Burkholderiaceae bacterium]|jgi:hypothetical protein|nr:hypothetical protein [Burkholderiaceae bacterium]